VDDASVGTHLFQGNLSGSVGHWVSQVFPTNVFVSAPNGNSKPSPLGFSLRKPADPFSKIFPCRIRARPPAVSPPARIEYSICGFSFIKLARVNLSVPPRYRSHQDASDFRRDQFGRPLGSIARCEQPRHQCSIEPGTDDCSLSIFETFNIAPGVRWKWMMVRSVAAAPELSLLLVLLRPGYHPFTSFLAQSPASLFCQPPLSPMFLWPLVAGS